MDIGGFCTDCGFQVTSFEGLDCCPLCHSTGVPCGNENQVDISINWHELRLLIIWAENWQREKVTNTKVIYSIARRIAEQHPGRDPLTLAEELGSIGKQFEGLKVSDPKLRQDIIDQTGNEPGLISPEE